METTNLTPDRALLAAAVVTTGVLFLPDASDPVNVIKLSALLLCAVTALVLAVSRVARDRVVQVPTGAPTLVGLALAAAFVVAAAVAPVTSIAVWGTLGRNSGLLAYGSALVLFFVGLRVLDRAATRWVVLGVLGAGLFTALYGLSQLVGVDAVAWNNPFNPIIAALGNPDFASAYLGIAAPAAAWGALWTGWPGWCRLTSGALAVLCLSLAVLSRAVQGPVAAAAGLTVLTVSWLLNREGAVRRAGLGVVGVATTLVVATLALGVTGAGPAAPIFARGSFQARNWYWEGALTMFSGSPAWGVGLDTYGVRWPAARPVAIVRALGGSHFSDSAHSVPLQMLAQGGLVLGLTYLAFIGVTGVLLVLGLRRLRGEDRLLLGALGGCWVAYQVQSFVSIDQVPLLTLHYVLAAAVIVAAGGVRLREVRLPGAVPVAAPPATRRRAASVASRRREVTGADRALIGVAVVVGLTLGWQALVPVRASRAVFAGDVALARGDGDGALAGYGSAVQLAPYVAAYHERQGALDNKAGRPAQALTAYNAAIEVDPFDVAALRTAGRLADAAGDVAGARPFFVRAARLDPLNSETVLDLARFDLKHGHAAEARALLERTVVRLSGDAGLWASLGDARLVTGNRRGATTAYARALAIDPSQATAVAGASKLKRM